MASLELYENDTDLAAIDWQKELGDNQPKLRLRIEARTLQSKRTKRRTDRPDLSGFPNKSGYIIF